MRADGLDVNIDRDEPHPAEGWPQWMIRQIEESDFVLCVCSPNYRERMENRSDSNVGKGARLEGHIITTAIYEKACRNDKFVPVFFGGGSPADIPAILQSSTYYKLPNSYEALYARLSNQERPKSKLGAVRLAVDDAEDAKIGRAGEIKNQERVRWWPRSDVIAVSGVALAALTLVVTIILSVSPDGSKADRSLSALSSPAPTPAKASQGPISTPALPPAAVSTDSARSRRQKRRTAGTASVDGQDLSMMARRFKVLKPQIEDVSKRCQEQRKCFSRQHATFNLYNQLASLIDATEGEDTSLREGRANEARDYLSVIEKTLPILESCRSSCGYDDPPLPIIQ